MAKKPYDHLFKLLLIGDSGVGKSDAGHSVTGAGAVELRWRGDRQSGERDCDHGLAPQVMNGL